MPKPTAISFRETAKVLNTTLQRVRTMVDRGIYPSAIGPDGHRYIVREAIENIAARLRSHSLQQSVRADDCKVGSGAQCPS